MSQSRNTTRNNSSSKAGILSTVSSSSSQNSDEEVFSQYTSQNRQLRSKLFDLQLKQREYISKILELQTHLAKMNLQFSNNFTKKSRSSIECNLPQGVALVGLTTQINPVVKQRSQPKQKQAPKSKQKSKQQQKRKDVDTARTGNEEKKFCEVVAKTYNELFGISSLKQIWKKHKQILQDWLLHQNSSERK